MPGSECHLGGANVIQIMVLILSKILCQKLTTNSVFRATQRLGTHAEELHTHSGGVWSKEPFFETSLWFSFSAGEARALHAQSISGRCVCMGTNILTQAGSQKYIHLSIHPMLLRNYSKSSLNIVNRFCNFK